LSVILGEDEVAQGKVKIKENGLRDGHPEKEGVLVSLDDLVYEVKQRIDRKANLDALIQTADGLRVVGGIKSDGSEKIENVAETPKPVDEAPAPNPSVATPDL